MHIFLIDRLIQAIVLYRKRKETIRILNALNDHMLKDIGIERHNILSATDRLIAEEKERLDRARQSVPDKSAKQKGLPAQCVEPA